jgi:hypothetical protein
MNPISLNELNSISIMNFMKLYIYIYI